MAKVYKVLSQINPAAITATDMYTVPTNTQVVVSTMTICNLGNTAATYRIAIRPDGEELLSKHYIAFDSTVGANDTVALTLGLTANSSDVFTVYGSSANISFGLFGSEIN